MCQGLGLAGVLRWLVGVPVHAWLLVGLLLLLVVLLLWLVLLLRVAVRRLVVCRGRWAGLRPAILFWCTPWWGRRWVFRALFGA
jgi:hypothetical protein